MEQAEAATKRRTGFWLHAATLLAVAVGLFSMLGARGTFSVTFEESNHLAAGLEWWQFGSYSMWTAGTSIRLYHVP